MKKIITISRECCSGGKTVAHKLSEKLGYKYYDKELIDRVSKESGLAKEYIEEQGELITGSLLFNIASNMNYASQVFGANMLPIQDQLYVVQSDIIKKIADEGNCIIVGRCADYILRDRDDVLNVFIEADMDEKVRRAEEMNYFEKGDIVKQLKKRDKARANHYRYYTEQEWGNAKNYDLVLNSSEFGIETCADVIAMLVQKANEK